MTRKVKVLLKFSKVLIRVGFYHTFVSVIKTTTNKQKFNVMKKSDKTQLANLVRANVNKGVTKKADKKTGVLQTMINLLTEGYYTKETLLDELCAIFPEREESSMKCTINAQLAGKKISRLEKERGVELQYKNRKFGTESFSNFKIKGFKDWSLEDENEDED